MNLARIILSASALTLGLMTSIYFIVWSWRHKGCPHTKVLRLWALALFLMYWYQLPAILLSIKKVIVVSNFNFFFALTLPVTFLAFIFIFVGIIKAFDIHVNKLYKILIALWFLSAILFFSGHFIYNGGVIKNYTLPVFGNVFFYLPIRFMILFFVARWFSNLQLKDNYSFFGAGFLIIEAIFGIMRNFYILKNVMAYPPELWYVVLGSSQFFFVTQTLSVILLALGFYFIHHYYFRIYKRTQT